MSSLPPSHLPSPTLPSIQDASTPPPELSQCAQFDARHLLWSESRPEPLDLFDRPLCSRTLSSAASSVDSSPPATPVSALPNILGPSSFHDYSKSAQSFPPSAQLSFPPLDSPLQTLPYNSLHGSFHSSPPSCYQPLFVNDDPLQNISSWTSHSAWMPLPDSASSRPQSRLRKSRCPQPLTPRLVILACLLMGSFIIIALLVATIPDLHLPTSLTLVRAQISHLRAYAASSTAHYVHLVLVLSIIFIWKQAFSIPGTVLVNILLGALYGTWVSTLLTSFLTAIGSTLAYAMARLARPVVERWVPKPLQAVEDAVDRFKTSDGYDTIELSSYFLVARLLPVVPYAALNLASGVLELPLGPFFWTLVIGSLPYNFLTTQVGDILSLASENPISTIWSPSLIGKLALVSVTGALPILLKSRLRPWFAKTRRLKISNRRRRMALGKAVDLEDSPSMKAASIVSDII